MQIKKGWASLWPPIIDIISAQKASKQGVWACMLCAGATILIVLVSVSGQQYLDFDIDALLDASLFVIIGWGIHKMNRVAAIAGLTLYVFERAVMWSEYGAKNPVVALIITLMFINSARGIFAYHRFSKGPILNPPQSDKIKCKNDNSEDLFNTENCITSLNESEIDRLKSLNEQELRTLIYDTNIKKEYAECKIYLEWIIKQYPESRFIDFIARDRLRDVNLKLGVKK